MDLRNWIDKGIISKRQIEQSPLSKAPDVPAGTSGYVEDHDEPWLLVNFGADYGVVICSPRELRLSVGIENAEQRRKL